MAITEATAWVQARGFSTHKIGLRSSAHMELWFNKAHWHGTIALKALEWHTCHMLVAAACCADLMLPAGDTITHHAMRRFRATKTPIARYLFLRDLQVHCWQHALPVP